jgi:hypothetical protein
MVRDLGEEAVASSQMHVEACPMKMSIFRTTARGRESPLACAN